MIIEIIRRTPPWAFVLFFILLGVGLAKFKSKEVSTIRAIILPTIMIILSLFGVVSVFKISFLAIFSWFFAVSISLFINKLINYPSGVTYNSLKNTFVVPGSYMPLIIMMAIYFTKFGVSVALARNPSLAVIQLFKVTVSFSYGVYSGIFLGSAISILKTKKTKYA